MNRTKNPWAITAVALLPVLVLGVLLAALWNPMDRLDTVPAAIVNADEPVEVDGQTAPLGRQLAAGLVGGAEDSDVNYDWTVTDAEHAADGLADGTYAAVVTIPEDFSAAATSFGSEDAADARKATIDISTPADGRVVDDALARVVATTATSIMGSTLTETYVDNVLVGFGDIADGVGEAADGAHQLADGADDAADGAGDLADGAGDLADGADQYADGVGEAASGADQLASGADQYAAGVGDAASGAQPLADGANQVADGAAGVDEGAQPLADGAAELADGADQTASGAAALATGTQGISGGIRESADGADGLADGGYELADGADELAAGVGQLATQAGEIDETVPGTDDIEQSLAQVEADLGTAETVVGDALDQAAEELGCATDATTPECERLAEVQENLAGASEGFEDEFATASETIVGARGELTALAAGTEQLAAGADELATGTRGIADGNAELGDGLRDLAAGNDQVADGADDLSTGAGQLADGAGDLADGSAQLAAGTSQLADGASGLAGGVTELAGGLGQLNTGASDLATGVSGFADGFGQLNTGAQDLATGATGIADGTDGLADGVGELATGTDDLAGGLDDAVDGIPTYTDSERQNLSDVVADPVGAPGVDDLSTGATGPLFAVVALWLGALGLLTIFPPVAARALGTTRSALRLLLDALAVPAAVGAGTGAVVGAILAGVEGMSPWGWVGAILVGALVSVAFVAVHLGFLAWLGNLGRGISLLIAVLMIGTGVVATVPAALVSVADLLPTGAARDALAAVVVPEVGGLGGALTWLVLWTFVGLALGAGAAARARRTRVAAVLRV